jgi:hypothetical protein
MQVVGARDTIFIENEKDALSQACVGMYSNGRKDRWQKRETVDKLSSPGKFSFSSCR